MRQKPEVRCAIVYKGAHRQDILRLTIIKGQVLIEHGGCGRIPSHERFQTTREGMEGFHLFLAEKMGNVDAIIYLHEILGRLFREKIEHSPSRSRRSDRMIENWRCR